MTSHWASGVIPSLYPHSLLLLTLLVPLSVSLRLLHDSCLLLVIISSNLKLKESVQELFQYALDADTYCLHLYNSTYMRDLVFQSINCIQLFATPWTAAHQASLSFTISQSLLKLMSIDSAMPSNHLILCRPLLLLPSIFPSIRGFSNESNDLLTSHWSKYLPLIKVNHMANSYSNNSTSGWKKRIVDFLILPPVDNSEEEDGPILSVGIKEERRRQLS